MEGKAVDEDPSMEASKKSTSETFTFCVGAEKKEFHVEVDPIARMSKPLSILMKGSMKEGLEKRADLPEVEYQVFKDFLQFVQTGECPSLIMTIHKEYHRKTANVSESGWQNAMDDGLKKLKHLLLDQKTFHCFQCGIKIDLWCDRCARESCNRIYAITSDLDERHFCCRYCGDYVYGKPSCSHCNKSLKESPDLPPSHIAEQLTCNVCSDTMITDSWRNIPVRPRSGSNISVASLINDIHHHCKMYIFADMYSIETLRQTMLCLIWAELMMLAPEMNVFSKADFSPLVGILEYIVSNTRSSVDFDPVVSQTDRLCELITSFVTLKRREFMGMKEYTQLIERDTDMMKELFLASLRLLPDPVARI